MPSRKLYQEPLSCGPEAERQFLAGHERLVSRRASGHLFEFRPCEQISQAGLKIVRLGFVAGRRRLPMLGYQDDALRSIGSPLTARFPAGA